MLTSWRCGKCMSKAGFPKTIIEYTKLYIYIPTYVYMHRYECMILYVNMYIIYILYYIYMYIIHMIFLMILRWRCAATPSGWWLNALYFDIHRSLFSFLSPK
jgi:hypothetical protein